MAAHIATKKRVRSPRSDCRSDACRRFTSKDPAQGKTKKGGIAPPFFTVFRAPLLRGAALRGLGLVAALGSLLAFDVLAGGLIHRLHGQAHFAALVHAEELYFHLVAFLDDVGDLVHPAWCQLADMYQPVLGAEEVNKSAEVHDF